MIRKALLALALLAAPANAHRGHDAISSVTLEKDGRVTVVHRVEASDIEPALAIIAPAAQPSLDDPEAVAALIAYLGNRFALTADGRPIKLEASGSDLSGGVIAFDFTGRTSTSLRQLTVTSEILTDVHPRQINQVTLRMDGKVQTLTFRQGGSQTVKRVKTRK